MDLPECGGPSMATQPPWCIRRLNSGSASRGWFGVADAVKFQVGGLEDPGDG